jgi:hypothetical protein
LSQTLNVLLLLRLLVLLVSLGLNLLILFEKLTLLLLLDTQLRIEMLLVEFVVLLLLTSFYRMALLLVLLTQLRALLQTLELEGIQLTKLLVVVLVTLFDLHADLTIASQSMLPREILLLLKLIARELLPE